jgi:hypothetical protein
LATPNLFFFLSLPYNYKLQQADNNYIGQMQNMAMKPVLKSNLSIQMAQKTLQNMAMKDTLKSNLSIQTAKKTHKI